MLLLKMLYLTLMLYIDESLFTSSLEYCSMIILFAKILINRVKVRVEMDKSNRTMLLRYRSEFSKRNRMISTHANGDDICFNKRKKRVHHSFIRIQNISGINRHITIINA